MATTTTSITPDPIINPFSGRGELGNYRSTAARAQIVFKINQVAVTVAGSGEFQRVVVNMNLPLNFSYTLADFSARISGVNADDWSNVGELTLNDSDGSNRSFLFSQEVISTGVIDEFGSNASKARFYCPCGPFLRALMIQQPGLPAPLVFHTLSNPVIDGAVGVYSMYARFLVYDVNQTHHVEVNTPLLIR